eukprot:scaffold204616_cov28-Tisochrysis_lutea.AAC.2
MQGRSSVSAQRRDARASKRGNPQTAPPCRHGKRLQVPNFPVVLIGHAQAVRYVGPFPPHCVPIGAGAPAGSQRQPPCGLRKLPHRRASYLLGPLGCTE